MTHNRSERFTREPARHYRDREDQSYLWEEEEESRAMREARFESERPEKKMSEASGRPGRFDRDAQIRRYSQLYGDFAPYHGVAPLIGASQGDDFGYYGGEDIRFPGRYAGMGPKGFKRTDERIKEEVSEMLTRDSHIDARDIEVKVKDGEVTLTGTLSDRKMKFAAEDCASRCLGVRDVTNLIRIQTSVTTPTPQSQSH